MSDAVVVVAVVASFALLCTAHLAIAAGLLARQPRWRALVGLIAPPLAPYWAAREKMWVRVVAWIVGLLVYAAARIAGGT